jgi:hypothetical protein
MQPELVWYLQATAGFPTKPTWLAAIKKTVCVMAGTHRQRCCQALPWEQRDNEEAWAEKSRADSIPPKLKNPPMNQRQHPTATTSKPTQAPKNMMDSSKYFQLKRGEAQPPLPIKQANSPRNQAKATNT